MQRTKEEMESYDAKQLQKPRLEMNMGRQVNSKLASVAGFTEDVRTPPRADISKLVEEIITELLTRCLKSQGEGWIEKRVAVQAVYSNCKIPDELPYHASPFCNSDSRSRPYANLASEPILHPHLFFLQMKDRVKPLANGKIVDIDRETAKFLQSAVECMMVFVLEECLALYKSGDMTPQSWIEKIKESHNIWTIFNGAEGIPDRAFEWIKAMTRDPKKRKLENASEPQAKKKPKVFLNKRDIRGEDSLKDIIREKISDKPRWINGLRQEIQNQYHLEKAHYKGKWHKFLKGLNFVQFGGVRDLQISMKPN